MFKRLARSAFVGNIAGFLIGAYIRLVDRTARWTVVGKENFDAAAADGKGVIVTFWHGRLMMASTIRRLTDQRVFMLISNHRDGEIITKAVKDYDIEFIRGSAANPNKPEKNKQGASAIAQMLAALKDGHVVGVTPDGPRGPAEKVHIGVIKLAQFSGAPIIPGANSMSRGRRLGTWDRFLLPGPFSRGVQVGLAPIRVPADADFETVKKAREALEKGLCEATEQADALAGRSDTPDNQG